MLPQVSPTPAVLAVLASLTRRTNDAASVLILKFTTIYGTHSYSSGSVLKNSG